MYHNLFRRNHLVILAIVLLFTGLLFNRVVHSIGIFFGCIYIVSDKDWLKKLISDRYLLSFLSLSVIILFFDVIHSPDRVLSSTFFSKLALLVYPLLIKIWNPEKKDISKVLIGFITVSLINFLYSIWHLISDYQSIIDAYKRAKVLPTLALGDHIRMSWIAVIGIWSAMYLKTLTENNLHKKLFWSFIILSIIYIHILSVKTGLLLFYGSAIIYMIYFLLEGDLKNFGYSVLILIIIPFVSLKFFPSLQNRLAYVVWDISEHLKGNRQPGLSDGSRILSIKAGWHISKDNLLTGVGHLNLRDATYKWYAQYEPKMPKMDYIMPSSQFLIFFASCGIVGFLIFLIHLILPGFLLDFIEGKLFYILYIPSAFTFLYETHLEGQYAIFVYSFCTYLFFHLCKVDK